MAKTKLEKWTVVLFINSETCVVYDKLDVSELNEEAGINNSHIAIEQTF